MPIAHNFVMKTKQSILLSIFTVLFCVNCSNDNNSNSKPKPSQSDEVPVVYRVDNNEKNTPALFLKLYSDSKIIEIIAVRQRFVPVFKNVSLERVAENSFYNEIEKSIYSITIDGSNHFSVGSMTFTTCSDVELQDACITNKLVKNLDATNAISEVMFLAEYSFRKSSEFVKGDMDILGEFQLQSKSAPVFLSNMIPKDAITFEKNSDRYEYELSTNFSEATHIMYRFEDGGSEFEIQNSDKLVSLSTFNSQLKNRVPNGLDLEFIFYKVVGDRLVAISPFIPLYMPLFEPSPGDFRLTYTYEVNTSLYNSFDVRAQVELPEGVNTSLFKLGIFEKIDQSQMSYQSGSSRQIYYGERIKDFYIGSIGELAFVTLKLVSLNTGHQRFVETIQEVQVELPRYNLYPEDITCSIRSLAEGKSEIQVNTSHPISIRIRNHPHIRLSDYISQWTAIATTHVFAIEDKKLHSEFWLSYKLKSKEGSENEYEVRVRTSECSK